MPLVCPNCEAPLQAVPVPDEPVRCGSCSATMVMSADGTLDVTAADGDTFDVEPEELIEAEPS